MFEGFRSLALVTVARFVTPGKAAEPTTAVISTMLEAPASTAPAFVQVTSWPAAEQVQSVPDAET